MKGVEVCEKPGGVDKRALIPGFPNCSCAEYIGAWRPTWGTETSKYPVEKKEKSIPSVAASESGIAQTTGVSPVGL